MKIGILNCSDIARRRMIPAIKSVDGIDITIICSRTLEKAKEYANQFGVPAYTDNPEDLFTNVDAVYISSPPSEHFYHIMKFLDKGIHVLCEKSLTTRISHTKSIINKADKCGLIVQENYGFIFHDQWKWILKTLPELGDVLSVNSGFEFPPRDKQTDFRYKKELGGGALMDAGGYPIKVASMLMNKINLSRTISSCRFSKKLEVDLSGNACLLDDRGTSAFLSWSFESPYKCDIEITGTKGRLRSKKIFTSRPDEIVTVERCDEFGKILEVKEFKTDHFIELIKDFKRRVQEIDNSHHNEILKQASWQSYIKNNMFKIIC